MKRIFSAKRIAQGVLQVLVAPMAGIVFAWDRATHSHACFAAASQALSLIPGKIGAYSRAAFYSWTCRRCSLDARIAFGTLFSHPDLSIGTSVYVGAYCCIGRVTLENNVLIGSHVSIMNGSRQHGIDRIDIPIRLQPGRWPRVTIGCDTWIGDQAIVMVDVGRHCVVGAGAVVTKPVPDYAIVVGNPARVVRFRNAVGPACPSGSASVTESKSECAE